MPDEVTRLDALLREAVPPSTLPYTAATPLTAESVRAFIEKIRDEPMRAHGTEDWPHLLSPNPNSYWYDHCVDCGVSTEALR